MVVNSRFARVWYDLQIHSGTPSKFCSMSPQHSVGVPQREHRCLCGPILTLPPLRCGPPA